MSGCWRNDVAEPPRVNVLGVGVSALDMQTALDLIESWVSTRERTYVCVCTVHGIMECRRSSSLRETFNSAGLVTPDGMPLVWLARAAGHRRADRVYGPDLMLAELARQGAPPHRHFFYGGAPGVATELRRRLEDRFPGLAVAGVEEPPMATLDELCSTITAQRINAAAPDIVWVGLGTPKQDLWMARMRPLLDAPILIGVGAAFDFHAGRIPQAPRWMQRSGLEWSFRLAVEPRRLWRRYLVYNSWFLLELVLKACHMRRHDLP
jgi:N-acetylglucosaminyldiphosphoundecaprenol N-acetyl-beta-D-mannosaminyltransferase